MARTAAARRRATFRVSATSANLGPGFDSLALCLDLRDDVSAEVDPDSSGCDVEITGEGALDLPRDERHVIISTMRQAWRGWGVDRADAGITLRCRNGIPQGRGLGSSAAAVVAGLLLAKHLAPGERLSGVDQDMLLAEAARIEGHADNVAACMRGGLTLTWTDRGPCAVRLPDPVDVDVVVLVSPRPLATASSRAVLPAEVPLAAAAANAARTALLVRALTARPDLLLAATQDRLHQEARRPLMPQTLELVDALRARGIAAAVSGAGPSVLCLVPAGEAAAVLRVVQPLLPPAWQALETSIGMPAVDLLE